MKDVIFNIFAVMTILPCLWVAFSSNIVHATFSLFFTLFGIAGLYVLLGADFLAVVQVIIYIGGILVLIIFGVMMIHRAKLASGSVRLPGRLFAALLAEILLIALLMAVHKAEWPLRAVPGDSQPTTEAIGDLLLGKYLVPFEVASILLLAALVGAVLIVRTSVKGA
jgi:NADH-quinone oxidoreductase subunit J